MLVFKEKKLLVSENIILKMESMCEIYKYRLKYFYNFYYYFITSALCIVAKNLGYF